MRETKWWKFWGFHICVCTNSVLLECDAMSRGNQIPMLPWHIRIRLPINTASHPKKLNTWWWKLHVYNGKNHEDLSCTSQPMHREQNLRPNEYNAQSWSRHFMLCKDQTADNHLVAGKGAHVWSDHSGSRIKDSCSIKRRHMLTHTNLEFKLMYEKKTHLII